LVMWQSNIPAGATIGSNHNSRAADGEIVAGRGFWPGLCVSLKHNSKFASFTMLAKDDYMYELNIQLPFSLVSVDLSKDELRVMPGYWFMYNMYALARNSWKFGDRDLHITPIQQQEYNYLAPDTVNEMFNALSLLEYFTGKAFYKKENAAETANKEACITKGKDLLSSHAADVDALQIEAEGFENSKRKTIIIKTAKAYSLFKQLITYYGASQLIAYTETNKIKSLARLQQVLPLKLQRHNFVNAGGQLIQQNEFETLKEKIRSGKIKSWDQLHGNYATLAEKYALQKTWHALASLQEITGITLKKISAAQVQQLLQQAVETREWISEKISDSRAKDYSNEFRTMVYGSQQEMDKVMGKLEDNSFIKKQKQEFAAFKETIAALKKQWKLK
ncbi:MAG TPA: DUF4954 family protein, partial [Chitinophagaceae bacterium]|nr:DUF4954 family protein [Chitinophagaceae bacterium]